ALALHAGAGGRGAKRFAAGAGQYRVRQAWRAEPLRTASATAISRRAHRSGLRKPRGEHLSLGPEGSPLRSAIPGRRRKRPADGAGLDGFQVPAGTFDARLQCLLATLPAGAASHGRLSGGRAALQARDCPGAAIVGHRRSAVVARAITAPAERSILQPVGLPT